MIWELDFCEELSLSNEELECNNNPIETDRAMTFNPDFTLSKMQNGFRIFAFEESLNGISARRYKFPGPDPSLKTVFLHPRIAYRDNLNPSIEVMIKTDFSGAQTSEILALTFDHPIPTSFNSGLLGGLLLVLQNTTRNIPLLICSSSDFLIRMLIKDRERFENDLLDPNFRLIRAVVAMLNERVARIKFMKVAPNPARLITDEDTHIIEADLRALPGLLMLPVNLDGSSK